MSLPDRNDERYVLGQALLAALAGIMVTIFTVSSISVIPWIYWAFAGLGVGYSRVLLASGATARAPEAQPAMRDFRAAVARVR